MNLEYDIEVFEYDVAMHYAPALVNGDTSGLEIDEEQGLNDWLERELTGIEEQYGKKPHHCHIDVVTTAEGEDGEEVESKQITTDDVTGLLAECYPTNIVCFFEKK